MHLMWTVPDSIGPVISAWVTLEITEPPKVDVLYFWALQCSFTDAGGADYGAAHTGLQWNPNHPGGRAVNWGGYPPAHNKWQTQFGGTEPTLPTVNDDPNTRTYGWQPHRKYRLSISPSPDRGWRASVTDLSTHTTTVVRDLWAEGDRLSNLMVWTEWFCDCDDPPCTATWSEFRVRTADGHEHLPTQMFINHPNENCTNVGHRIDATEPELVISQLMNSTRKLQHGTVIPVRSTAGPSWNQGAQNF